MASLAAQLQALHLEFQFRSAPGSRVAQPRGGLGHTLLRHQGSQSSASHRHAAYLVPSVGSSGEQWSRGGGGGGGGGGTVATTTTLDTSRGSLAWQAVASALDQRQLDVALQEFSYLLDQDGQPPSDLCNRLLSALCGAQRCRDALRAYGGAAAAGCRLHYNTYQGLISTALRCGELEAALDVFRDLQGSGGGGGGGGSGSGSGSGRGGAQGGSAASSATSAGGLTVNVVTYCGLIAALGRERRRGVRYAQAAHELWTELAGSGTALDDAAYRTGLKACVDAGRLREADRLLQRMMQQQQQQQQGQQVPPPPPDVRPWNILLAGHSRAANTAAMSKLLQRMGGAGVAPSGVTYNTLIDGYVRAGDMGAARRVLAQAQAASARLDAWTYNTLIKGYVQAGDLEAAEGALRDMRAAGVKPTCVTYTTLIDGHVRARDMGAARRVMAAMAAAGEAPNAVTYNALLKGYCREAQAAAAAARSNVGRGGAAPGGGGSGSSSSPSLSAALGVLRDMTAQGVPPSVDTFNTLMTAAMAAGDPQLALELHQRLEAAGLRPDGLTYTSLIQAYGRLGRVRQATEAFDALLRDRSATPDLPAYNALVDALARNGDLAAAERVLSAACELAARQGDPPPVEAFGAMVAGHARQMAVGPAVAVVKRFHAAGGSPDAQMLDILANIAIRAGDYKVAMQSVRALELIGREVDRAKYAALLQDVKLRQQQVADRPQHNRTWGEYQRRREARARNVHLERFKWLLGLANTYYSDEDDDDDGREYEEGGRGGGGD